MTEKNICILASWAKLYRCSLDTDTVPAQQIIHFFMYPPMQHNAKLKHQTTSSSQQAMAGPITGVPYSVIPYNIA